MSTLSPGGVGVGAGEDPQEQNPRGWTGQRGEGMSQSTGPAGVQTQGSQPSGLGGPRRHARVPSILGGWGVQKVLGSRVRWSGQLSAEVGLRHSGGGAGDKNDMGSG